MERSDPQATGPIDRLLDAAVVPGFTRLGWGWRSRHFEPLPDASGKTVVITGASAGLGFAVALSCAGSGASVVMISRDPVRGEAAAGRVRAVAAAGAEVTFEQCDMSSLAQVRKTAGRIGAARPSIDALVLNAGVLPQQRLVTDDGIELAWATNVIGPYLLEHLLLDRLEAASGRVIHVTSGGAYSQGLALPDGDLDPGDYDGPAVYARTKRAQIALTELQAEQFAGRGIAVHAVHPGWADTPGVQSSLPTFRKFTRPLLRSAEQGADTISWLALVEPDRLGSGLLWHDRRPRPRYRLPGTRESAAERLALDSELQRLAGLSGRDGARG